MSYEVVARRWRPLTFASVVGQGHVTRTLANAILRDRIPHAFLLTGTRGVGKTTVARLLARAINCSNRGESAEPCNDCPSCRQGVSGSSLDIIEIDGASNNGVDEVRALIEAAQYRPSKGRFKVYIIDEVHQLSRPAFNALLKILEEPPSHVKFIMATTEVHKLPETVLSRCQRYDFRRLSDEEIARQLAAIAEKDGMPVSPEAVALLAREADGSMRDAQSLLEQVMAGAEGELGVAEVSALLGVAGADLVHGMVEAILGGDAAKVVDLVGEVRRYGYDVERLLGELLELLRHVTVAQVAGPAALEPSLPASARERVTALRGRRSPLDLQRIFASLLQTASDLRRGSQPDLVLEMGLLKVASFEPVETAAALLARLGMMDASPARAAAPARTAPPSAAAPSARAAAASPGASRPAAPARAASAPAAESRAAEAPRAPEAASSAGAAASGRIPLAGRPGAAQPESWSGGAPGDLGGEEEAKQRWEAFLDDVKRRYGLDLYVTVTNCTAVTREPGVLELVPKSPSFAAKLKNPTVATRVAEVARDHYGAECTVRVEDGSAAPAEGVTLQGIQDERKARKQATALADPFVDKAIADLGGRVARVSVFED